MNRINLIFLICIGLFLSGTLCAEENKGRRTNIRYKKDTTVEFSDVEVEGVFQKPEGFYSLKAKKTKFETLISPKYDFLDELKNSVYSIDEE